MKTERLVKSGILNNGEPRHYASWEPPRLPKLNMSLSGAVGEALYRRQRAHAPAVSHGRGGWMQLWHALKKG